MARARPLSHPHLQPYSGLRAQSSQIVFLLDGFDGTFPCAGVARIQQCRSEWGSSTEAYELTGVSPSVLSHIVAAGVICADANWRHDLLKGGHQRRNTTRLH